MVCFSKVCFGQIPGNNELSSLKTSESSETRWTRPRRGIRWIWWQGPPRAFHQGRTEDNGLEWFATILGAFPLHCNNCVFKVTWLELRHFETANLTMTNWRALCMGSFGLPLSSLMFQSWPNVTWCTVTNKITSFVETRSMTQHDPSRLITHNQPINRKNKHIDEWQCLGDQYENIDNSMFRIRVLPTPVIFTTLQPSVGHDGSITGTVVVQIQRVPNWFSIMVIQMRTTPELYHGESI